jgi:ankyrin repeat protein
VPAILQRLFGSLCILLVASVALAAIDTRLIDAVKKRDGAAVAALLKQRVDVNATQGDGATALHWAVHRDDLATVNVLLKAGARANVANDTGVTPLYLACTNRNSTMVERLLTAGADPNATLVNGETMLMNCARTGNAASVKALLVRGADVNAKEPLHSQTALMWAAAQKHPEVVKVLIEARADVNARALTYSQIVTSETTQRAGREELNYTVLKGGSTPLLFAARSGDAESARLLVEAGANPSDELPDGMSALVEAAFSGHGNVGLVLLEKGANPNADRIGFTALHAAILRSDLTLVKALVAKGAQVNAQLTKGTPIRRNNDDWNLPITLAGATPYVLAAKLLQPEIMAVLVDAGADTKIAMKDGTTALMAAAGGGAGGNRRGGSGPQVPPGVVEAVEAALKAGNDINATNAAGETALHVAAARRYDPVIQLLADKGANLNSKNRRGQTPLGALLGGGQRRPDAAGNVDTPDEKVEENSTITLLRKLGAQD